MFESEWMLYICNGIGIAAVNLFAFFPFLREMENTFSPNRGVF
jgi:hypothetical protein